MADEKSETTPAETDDKFVHPLDGPEHGYVGRLPHDEPADAHTVASVTGGTANVDDEPKSARAPKRATAKQSE
ncbi:hypothetical protein ACWEOE_28935 [Amycolatopsis sp. NPDC004368]